MARFELGSLMPSKRLFDIANLIIRLNTSATRTNSRGESGSPCRRPRADLIRPHVAPLIEIDEKIELRMHWIQMHHFVGKPLCSISSRMNCQLTVSKAFEKSSLRSIPGVDIWW